MPKRVSLTVSLAAGRGGLEGPRRAGDQPARGHHGEAAGDPLQWCTSCFPERHARRRKHTRRLICSLQKRSQLRFVLSSRKLHCSCSTWLTAAPRVCGRRSTRPRLVCTRFRSRSGRRRRKAASARRQRMPWRSWRVTSLSAPHCCQRHPGICIDEKGARM